MQTKRDWLRCGVFVAALAWLGGAQPAVAQVTLLHGFAGGPGDGQAPQGDLMLSGSTLYGMTKNGGSDGRGMLFRMSTGGTGYTNLHSFGSTPFDGWNPRGALVLAGSELYGMTKNGGASNVGVVFMINTNGTGHTLLHTFDGGLSDGGEPYGSLTLSGSTLYGMTQNGGISNEGVVFRMSLNGTSYTNLHSFTGIAGDGSQPRGSLTLSGSTLYGMTSQGGGNGGGTVFKIDTNGAGFTNLHVFSGNSGGVFPQGSLALSGSTLYGMTQSGGSSNFGVVFKINTDGNGFTDLHHFAGGTGDGAQPWGSLTVYGSTLYGMTYAEGSSHYGTVFSINTDGTGYALVHSFAGSDGAIPYGSLTLSGSTFYGMTSVGVGAGKDHGVVFALTPSWDSGHQDLGGGWKWLSWFDYFNDAGNGWIYHNEHGWMYTPSTTPSSIWFWTSDLGWLWTSSTVYPSLYRNSTGQWLWYQKGSDNPRWFYNFSTSGWESHP